MTEVKILGTTYKVEEDDSIIKSDNADGVCVRYTKEIKIVPKELIMENCTEEEKELRYNEVLRHELVHAYFIEAGLANYSCDETLVDWLAVQIPKIVGTFKELNCE